MENPSVLNKIHSNFLLDEAWSPVARFRLLSTGVNTNTRLVASDRVVGDCACLACGNCIDACPVVRNNVGRVFNQNQRTSMSLENIVQQECRRCYRCVNSCPQVNKGLKEATQGFRRVEKVVHLLAALTIVGLAGTGVTYSHYGSGLGELEGALLKYGHRGLGILSILLPFLYYRFDVGHFRRTLKKVFCWGPQDGQWFRNAWSSVTGKKKDLKVSRHEFNPAQKIWYTFIFSVFPLLYLSGWSAILLGATGNETALVPARMAHMGFALSFDLMLFVHVYMKFIREWGKSIQQLYRNYQETKGFVFKG